MGIYQKKLLQINLNLYIHDDKHGNLKNRIYIIYNKIEYKIHDYLKFKIVNNV